VPLAGGRIGRLLYQRILLPFDASRQQGDEPVDRVLLLDAYAPLWRPQPRMRYAALVHDVLPLTHPSYWPASKRFVKRSAFGTLRRARATLFTSTEHNAQLIRDLLDLEPRVVRFGCGQVTDAEADAALDAVLPEREPNLLYVGAIEPRKDVLSLVTALEQSRELLEGRLRLTIVGNGDGAYARALSERVERSPLRSRIDLVPDASRQTTVKLLAHASALVFPSFDEGFGLPILEALALGTPAVAGDIPAIRSWAGDAIGYVSSGEPTRWVTAIEAAVNADDSRRRAGQDLAREYRWLACARALVDF